MARYFDSDFLFGIGSGVSTCGNYKCGFCGETYNEGADKTGDYNGDSVPVEHFAGLNVCYNCYETIENAILRRMPTILKWYCNILKSKDADIKKQTKQLKEVFDAIHGDI